MDTVGFGAAIYREFNVTFRGEFKRIAQQIVEYLADPKQITNELFRQRRQLEHKLQPFHVRGLAHHGYHFFEQRIGREWLVIDVEFPGFNFREIQHVVHDGQQVVGSRINNMHLLHFVGGQWQVG